MKVNGKRLSVPTAMVRFPRPGGEELRFTVRALPIGIDRLAERLFPVPAPPMRVVILPGTGKAVRDSDGAPIERPDLTDTAWKEGASHARVMQSIVQLVHALGVDPTVEWEAPRPADGSDEALRSYHLAIWEEVQQSGLTSGEVIALLDQADELSAIGDRELQESAESFRDPSPQPGGAAMEAGKENGEDAAVLSAPRHGED